MSSATLDCVPTRLPLDRAHVLMNKFPTSSDPDYRKVVDTIQRLLGQIQTGTPLAQADAWIREKYYNEQRLMIERLSGDRLEMDQCYINLALVETKQADIPKDELSQSSPFSLTERLKLKTPHESLRVELPNLFQPRRMPNRDMNEPRRILIRGRAGVGKTTLCKRIVHDFLHEGMWRDLFKRVVWVRLRDLKYLSNDEYNLGGMLEHIFLRQHGNGKFLAHQMWDHIEGTKAQDTVFLLDGLDEVTDIIMEPGQRPPHQGHELLKGLLNRPNVIITTRPHAAFPRGFQPLDLDLDTIGFSSDQVRSYIKAVMPNDKDSDAIQAYLQKNRIMQNLVQIPIQLDALCFTWQASSIWNISSMSVPETMTAVYEAMIKELWKKDSERLEKYAFPIIGNPCPAEIKPFLSTEYNNLGYLAFSGLYSNVIEFQPHHREALYGQMENDTTLNLTLDETFARLSFLRTSGSSENSSGQSFHFIHLTFQEYFSAKHFVTAWKKPWKDGQEELPYTELNGEKTESRKVSCYKFLQQHKYTARYDIMWRFVAGLLDAEGEPYITSFFEAIECEPLDLLGPTHQRLVMHCMAEVAQSVDLRTRLVAQLSQWVEFESNFRNTSRFISETEFPVRALNLALVRAAEESKMKILDSLRGLQSLPLETIELVTGWLKGIVSQQLRHAALRMLWLSRQRLPNLTLKAVIPLVDDKDTITSQYALWILQGQKDWPKDVLRVLIVRTESQDAGIKQITAKALKAQSTLPEDILRTIALWIQDCDESTRRAVLEVFRGHSKLPEDVIQAIVVHLRDQSQDIQLGAFEALRNQPMLPEDTLEHIVAWLEDEDDDSDDGHRHRRGQKGSRERRVSFGGLSDNIIQAVALRLKNQDASIRQKAMRILQLQRRHPDRAATSDHFFQVIVSWLGDQDRATRQFAFAALSDKTPLPDFVLEAVAAQLEDQDGTIRKAALSTLKGLASQRVLPDDVVRTVTTHLDDVDRAVAKTVLQALREISTRRRQALPHDVVKAVVAQRKSYDAEIQKEALETLHAVRSRQDFPNDVLEAVIVDLKSQDGEIRRAALEILGVIGSRQAFTDDVLNAIVAQLKSQAGNIRKQALATLRALGLRQTFPDAIQVIQAVAAQLEDQDNTIVREALRVLAVVGRLQAFAEDTLNAIAARLEERDSKTSELVCEALEDQSTLPDNILQAVAAQLQNEPWMLRFAALRVLNKRPSLRQDILRAVAAQLTDGVHRIRQTAIEVLMIQTELTEDLLLALTTLREDLWARCAGSHFRDVNISDVLRISRKQPDSSEAFLRAVVPFMEDESWSVRLAAVELLGTNQALPDEILQAVTTRLRDGDSDVRLAVVKALRGQRSLPDAILTSAALYPVWLARCFEEHVCCYVEDGVSYLELPGGLGRVRLEGQPDEFRKAIREEQMKLVMPI